MSRIPGLISFNNERKLGSEDYLKIKTADESTVLLTKKEAKAVLLDYISQELDLFADSLAKEAITLIDDKVAIQYDKFAQEMYQHIEDKINKITEKIITEALSHRIEEEVKKRVAIKLDKIKNEL
jgi:GTPase involved in cell partitioning and DNA repair